MSRLILASVVVVALTVSPALAITVDGDLTDWGIGAHAGVTGDVLNGNWVPTNGAGYALGDDSVHWTNSGGEWYDIEALYVNLNVGGNLIEWALITSYAGDEPSSGAALPSGSGITSVEQMRNGAVWDGTTLHQETAWTRHPVLALSFDNDYTGVDNDSYETWEYGVIMAPSHGGQGIGTGFTDNAQLWSVADWRGAHPNEFGPDLPGYPAPGYTPEWSGPVDFDVADSANALVASGGVNSSVAAPGYSGETTQVGTTWNQSENYIWEGSINLDGVMELETWSYVEFTYGLWCANNHTQGDRLGYGAPPETTPEASTWALLLCTVALGGYARRRRT